ncbi:UNVERIFIED_CONTAM: Pol polyprotein [Sesamum indicum]
MLHVDGSSNASNGGAGVLIQGPEGMEIEVAAKLSFLTTNNEAEYEALIVGLELAYEAGARALEVYTGSQLVAMQIEGSYETKERTMIMYRNKAKSLMERFTTCSIQQIPRCENDIADALSKFGALLTGIKNRKDGILPENSAQAKKLKFRATRFTLIESQSYKRSIEGPLLKCLDDEQASKVISTETDETRIFLADHAQRHEIIRPKMCELPKICIPNTCTQRPYANSQDHLPLRPVGNHILGLFPPARGKKKFIVVAVEYFSKWVEAEAVAKIFEKVIIDFIWKNIICRFGIPRVLISDNGTQFQGKQLTAWLKELKVQQNFTSVGHPQANRQTEVSNQIILQHLKSRSKTKNSWDEELPGVLWAYRTTPRSTTGETPFCLIYGSEATIPTEIGEETQRVATYDPEANAEARAFDLATVEERREKAWTKMLHHKGLMMRNKKKKLRKRELQVGDLVLKRVEVSKHVGKLDPGWEGPHKVVEIKRQGIYRLQDANGKDLPRPWNIQNLRKFYV